MAALRFYQIVKPSLAWEKNTDIFNRRRFRYSGAVAVQRLLWWPPCCLCEATLFGDGVDTSDAFVPPFLAHLHVGGAT